VVEEVSKELKPSSFFLFLYLLSAFFSTNQVSSNPKQSWRHFPSVFSFFFFFPFSFTNKQLQIEKESSQANKINRRIMKKK